MSDMKRWRHLIVAIGLVPSISVYVMACLYISGFVVGLHWASDLAFFICAGLVWLYPAALVVRWLAVTESRARVCTISHSRMLVTIRS